MSPGDAGCALSDGCSWCAAYRTVSDRGRADQIHIVARERDQHAAWVGDVDARHAVDPGVVEQAARALRGGPDVDIPSCRQNGRVADVDTSPTLFRPRRAFMPMLPPSIWPRDARPARVAALRAAAEGNEQCVAHGFGRAVGGKNDIFDTIVLCSDPALKSVMAHRPDTHRPLSQRQKNFAPRHALEQCPLGLVAVLIDEILDPSGISFWSFPEVKKIRILIR